MAKRFLLLLAILLPIPAFGQSFLPNTVMTPPSGTYATSQTITLSNFHSPTPTICYVVNGTPTAPTAGTCGSGSTVYSAPFTISSSQSISALATLAGSFNSPIVTNNYVILGTPLPAPSMSPASGSYASPQLVAISSTASGATICYAVNGTPTAPSPGTCGSGSTTYAGSFTVSASQSISALVTQVGFTNSPVTTNNYTIAIPANAGVNGYCSQGGSKSMVSGLGSTNYLNGVVIGCTITVYLTGTTTLAPYATTASGPLVTGPFTANTYGSLNPGGFLFFAPVGTGLDVVASGGIPCPGQPPPASNGCLYSRPVTILTDIIPGGGGSGGGGGGGLCGTVQLNFLGIGVPPNCIGSSSIYTDSTQNATITFPFNTSVNFVTPRTNFFGAAGVAGEQDFKQGTDAGTPDPNEVGLNAPASVPTPYKIHFPSTQGAGCWDNDGDGNSTWLIDCGASNLAPQIQLPAACASAQCQILFPTTATSSGPGSCAGGSVFGTASANGTNGTASVGANNCGSSGRSSEGSVGGFVYPSYITAGDVSQVYVGAISNFTQTGLIMSVDMACDKTSPYYTGFSIVGNPVSGGNVSAAGSYPIQQTPGAATLTTLVGTDVPNINCAVFQSGSASGSGFSATATAYSMFVIVLGTWTAPTPTLETLIDPPLTLSIDPNGNQDLGIDTSFAFPGTNLRNNTFAGLPNASATNSPGAGYLVLDGNTGCTAGGGSTPCIFDTNGSTYTGYPIGGGSSPLTTKGDVFGFSTVNARIPVGADGTTLIADSSQALGLKWGTPTAGADAGFGTLHVDVETAYSGANAGAKLIACLADGTLPPGAICDMKGILNEGTQPVPLGTAPIEVGRSGPQSVLWPSCDGPTNSFCGAVVQTVSTTLATPSAPTISCSTTGGNYHSAGVTFFAKVNYRTGDAVSASSTEVSCTLASTTTGSVTVTGPASCPTYTSEYDVTLSLTTGTETLQMNQACGVAAVFTNQDLFPISSAAPSAATALPAFIIHNNKSQFYSLFTGQTGFPFYTTGSTVATDMLATTDNGYSGISNIFLYNNGGGTIAHGMADNGVYAGSIRDHIWISAGSVNGMNIFGQVNDVTYNLPSFSCSSNSCDGLAISWWPQTVGDGESLATLNFNGMLISSKSNASNTGDGIRITGRPSTGSTFWESVGSGVGGININGGSLEMGASATNAIIATDFTGLNINGTKITRASFGGTAAVNINQTWNHSGQPYQSGNVSIDSASHIESFTDVVLNNVSTDPLATIAGTSGVSFDVPYKWGGGTSSLASPDYSYVIADMPVVFGAAAPVKAATITDTGLTSGNCVQASTGGLLTTTGSACGTGSGGSSVTVNGGSTLATANFNSTTPAAGSGFQNLPFQTSTTNVSVEAPLSSSSVFGLAKVDNSTITASAGVISAVTVIPSQYKTWSCQPGLGDGTNAITAATYLQTECLNTSGVTWTINSIKCFTDNSGTSTMAVTNGAGTALLTGAVTCSSSFASGTQSGTTTIAAGDFLKFTFVADGTSKQTTFVVSGTY